MKFSYIAKTAQGEVQTGVVEAGNRDIASSTLQSTGLIILRLEAIEKRGFMETFLANFRGVSLKEISIFTRQLSTLLEAEVPLIDSLRTLFQQAANVNLKEALFDIVSDVEGGASLSQSLSRHTAIFSQLYVEMVRSAEITGRLQEVFDYLAQYYEDQAEIIAAIRGAMIYPAFIFGFFGVAVFMLAFIVMPQLKQVFTEGGLTFDKLPIMTRFLFGLSDFLSNYGWPLVMVLIVLIFMVRAYLRSDEGREVFQAIVLELPIVGTLSRKIYIARFAQTASAMIKGDIPIAQTLEISAQVVGNSRYEDIIQEAAEAVRRGEFISEALARYPEDFPPLITQLIAVGEKTGRVDKLLERASNFYSTEVKRTLSILPELIQPILIAGLGIVVGLLVAAVLLPIYQLAETF